jgi:hypothetical protein
MWGYLPFTIMVVYIEVIYCQRYMIFVFFFFLKKIFISKFTIEFMKFILNPTNLIMDLKFSCIEMYK